MAGSKINTGTGIIVIVCILGAIGVVLLLDRAGLLAPFRASDFWPVILMVFGVIRLATPQSVYGKISGGVFVAVGVVLQLGILGLVSVNSDRVWLGFVALVAVYVVLVLVMRHLRARRQKDPPQPNETDLSGRADD